MDLNLDHVTFDGHISSINNSASNFGGIVGNISASTGYSATNKGYRIGGSFNMYYNTLHLNIDDVEFDGYVLSPSSGMGGFASSMSGVRAEIICDGFHIHPAALRIAFFMLGEDNSVIVSDAMKAAGCPDGTYDLGGQPVYVKDGKALLEDGTIAASTSNVYQELKNVISYGIPEKQAVKSATINPAKAIRVDKETGSLEVGKNADILVVDKDYNIKLVIVKGEIKVNNL